MSWVLEHSMAEGNDRLVLLSIANHASSAGHEAFPSRSTIAREARCSESTVKRSIRALAELGELAYILAGAPLGGPMGVIGNRRPNLYWLPAMPGCPGHDPEPGQVVIAQGVQVEPPEPVDNSPDGSGQGGQVEPPGDFRGFKSGDSGGSLVTHKPSVEPSFSFSSSSDLIQQSYPQAEPDDDDRTIDQVLTAVGAILAREANARNQRGYMLKVRQDPDRRRAAAETIAAHPGRDPTWLADEHLGRGHPPDQCSTCRALYHTADNCPLDRGGGP